MTESFSFDSCVRGYHAYSDTWQPNIGDTLTTEPEFLNIHDPYAVAVVTSTTTSGNTVVGHIPRNISTLCHLFLRRGGNIIVQITDRRRRSTDLRQGGLEVPCSLTFIGDPKNLMKIRKLKNMIPLPVLTHGEPPKKRAKTVHHFTEDDVEESESLWLNLNGIYLTQSDETTLINGEKLNDRHINYAQRILHNQFPDTQGLGNTLLQKKEPPKKIETGLQIIHSKGDHWIVASTMRSNRDNKVDVFDSVYSTIDEDTRKVILNLFKLQNNGATGPVIETTNMQRQVGAKECGLYAIAVATNILMGIETFEFQEHQMRNHLLKCIQTNTFTKFP